MRDFLVRFLPLIIASALALVALVDGQPESSLAYVVIGAVFQVTYSIVVRTI